MKLQILPLYHITSFDYMIKYTGDMKKKKFNSNILYPRGFEAPADSLLLQLGLHLIGLD